MCFDPEPAEAVLKRMADLAPREMPRAWMTAFGYARLAERDAVQAGDLPAPSGKRSPIGFMH